MTTYEIDRKKVKEILFRHGLQNRFRVRTIDFTDLARCQANQIKILKYVPRIWPNDEAADRVKEEIRALYPKVLIEFDYDPDWCREMGVCICTGGY